ncbi:MAG: YpmS family protein [Bacillus sp. (in: firmicutes)]
MKGFNWKRLFILLLGLNVALVFLLFTFFLFMINDTGNETKIPTINPTHKQVVLQIKTNKQDLNRVINHYLEKELHSTYDYQVLLTDQVELYGAIPIFNEELNVKLTFEPKPLENGDLELQQKNMSIGNLSLPPSLVLKFIQNSYSLPEWVMIQPSKEKIYVSLNTFKLKSNFKVLVNEFNLKDDDIRFSLQLPMD